MSTIRDDTEYAICDYTGFGGKEVVGGTQRACFNYLVSIPRAERGGLVVLEKTESEIGTSHASMMRLMSVTEFISLSTYRHALQASKEKGVEPDYYLGLRRKIGDLL